MGVPFYNVDPNKDRDLQGGQNSQVGQNTNTAANAPQSSSGSAFVSGGGTGTQPQQGQAGTGGQIPFTNIQTYMNANPNGGGGAAVLGNDVTKQIGDISSKADKDYDQFNSSIAASNAAIPDVSALDKQQRSNYAYDFDNSLNGVKNDNYSNITNQLKNYGNSSPALSSYYETATPQLNDYQSKLGDDQQFKGLMNTLYSNAASTAGTNMGSGTKALQEQLDSGQPLQDQRTQSASDISALNNKLSGYNTDAANSIATSQSKINPATSGAKDAVDKFSSDKAGFESYMNSPSYDQFGTPVGNGFADKRTLSQLLKDRNNGSEGQGKQQINQNVNNLYSSLLNKYGFGG